MASRGEGDSRLAHSQDFTAQIRQLEEEGNKLMAATHSLQTSLTSSPHRHRPSGALQISSPSKNGGLSALTDITEEQLTISQMRESLEARTHETESLRRQLRGSNPQPYSSPSTSRYNPSMLPSLDFHYQPSAPYSSYLPSYTDHSLDTNPHQSQEHLEQQLRQAQEEVSDLKTKVREAIRIAEQQKNQFRTCIEELRSQLHQAVRDRDLTLHNKSKESSSLEATITKQQTNIEQLEQANKIQEESLLEMNGKLEALQREHYAMDTLLAQVRTTILDREHRRGRPFYEAEPALRQSPSKLAYSLERCLHELEQDLAEKTHRLAETTTELDDLRTVWAERHQNLTHEQREKLTQQNKEHEKELQTASDRLVSARRQISDLQQEVASLQHETGQAVREKEEQIRELQEHLDSSTKDREREISAFKEKNAALELALDHIQKEITSARIEREEAIRIQTLTESKFEELKLRVSELEKEMVTEREQARKLASRDEETRRQLESVSLQLENKNKQLESLNQTLTAVRYESDQQLQQTLRSKSEEEQERYMQRLNDLTKQLTDVTEKYQDAKLQLEVLRAEHKNLHEQHKQVAGQLKTTVTRLEDLKVTKEQLSSSLQERLVDTERLSKEKETYFRMLGEKDNELVKVRSEADKQSMQLEDKTAQLRRLQEQHSQLMELSRAQEQQARSTQEQADKLTQQLHQADLDKQELLNSRENIIKRLKLREKHVRELEEDHKELTSQVRDMKQEVQVLQQEKVQAESQLGAMKQELSDMLASHNKLETALKRSHEAHKKEVKKLTSKLHASENEVKLAQKALKSQKDVDDRAVKVAGKMQKEVTEKRSQIDSLNSKMSWLQESLDSAVKSRQMAVEDAEALTAKLAKYQQQLDKMKSDMDKVNSQNVQLRNTVGHLEAALEKAALKHAGTQAQLEHFQQDVARLKLKHQLDLKELARNGHLKLGDFKATLAALKSPTATTGPGANVVQQVPDNQKPQTQVQNYVTDNVVGEQLRTLLDQMRELLYGQQQLQLLQQHLPQHMPQHKPSKHRRRQKSHREKSEEERDDFDTEVDNMSDSDTSNYNIPAVRELDKPKQESQDFIEKWEGAVDVTVSSIEKTRTVPPPTFYHPESPSVSEILLEEPSNDADYMNKPGVVNADSMCRRLEEKITNLAKLGSHLQKENQEIHDLITNDDEKFKQVKQYERNVQKLFKK